MGRVGGKEKLAYYKHTLVDGLILPSVSFRYDISHGSHGKKGQC